MLGIWPALPIAIKIFVGPMSDVDDTVFALGHGNRVCDIRFEDFSSSQSQVLLSAMVEPFPALERLDI